MHISPHTKVANAPCTKHACKMAAIPLYSPRFTAPRADTILALDHGLGAQTAAIVYSAPAFYRHPNCTGFVFGKDLIKGGCAPVDAHMDDYEDYMLMLMLRCAPRRTSPPL